MKIITIQVGGRNFTVNCPEGQEQLLASATAHLALRFSEIQQNAPTLPFDQILVLAALNDIVSNQQKIATHQANEQSTLKRLKRMSELFNTMVYAENND